MGAAALDNGRRICPTETLSAEFMLPALCVFLTYTVAQTLDADARRTTLAVERAFVLIRCKWVTLAVGALLT